MRMKLLEKYLPIDYEEMLFEELILLWQDNNSVNDYTLKFYELSFRSSIVETEWQLIARYKAGLRVEIKKELLMVRLVIVEEAYQLALWVEQQHRFAASRRSNKVGFAPIPTFRCIDGLDGKEGPNIEQPTHGKSNWRFGCIKEQTKRVL